MDEYHTQKRQTRTLYKWEDVWKQQGRTEILLTRKREKKKERKLFKKMQKKIPFSTHTNVNRNPDLSWNGSSGSFMKTRKKRTFFFFCTSIFFA